MISPNGNAGGYVWGISSADVPGHEMRACNCIGPQNGAPACPCMMPEHNRREQGRMLEILRRAASKPRVRVPAGRREVP
jgi:hypothetical protein